MSSVLAIDECFSNSYTTLGCILITGGNLPELEKLFTELRLKNKVWGEVKWSKVTASYLDKYKEFISKYLEKECITFHSWTYKNPSREVLELYYGGNESSVIYKHAYMLIRNVIKKSQKAGIFDPINIIADETGGLGHNEYKKISEFIDKERKLIRKPKIDFCGQGSSHVCGALQICDLCTGAVHYNYENSKVDSRCADEIVVLLKKINLDTDINFSPKYPFKLDEVKLQHFYFNP